MAAQTTVRSVESDRHVGSGNAQFTCDLGHGTFFDVAETHDVTVRWRQTVDRFQQDAQQVAPVQGFVGTLGA